MYHEFEVAQARSKYWVSFPNQSLSNNAFVGVTRLASSRLPVSIKPTNPEFDCAHVLSPLP
jgi:hypothetical protein